MKENFRSGFELEVKMKLLQRGMKQTELRITPAWAGKSYKNLFSAAMKKDHPRVGGEKSFTLIHPILAPGSPPRGRGKGTRCWTNAA